MDKELNRIESALIKQDFSYEIDRVDGEIEITIDSNWKAHNVCDDIMKALGYDLTNETVLDGEGEEYYCAIRHYSLNENGKLRSFVESNYKSARVYRAVTDDNTVVLVMEGPRYDFVAKKILDNYPNVKWVRFEGGFITSVYSRETLKWHGFKMK